MKDSESTSGGESRRGLQGSLQGSLPDRKNAKGRGTIGALVAIALAIGIGTEGYFLYKQSQDIDMLARKLGNEELLTPWATVGRSRMNLAGTDDAYELELGIKDLIVLDQPDRYVVEARMPNVDPSEVRVGLDGRRLRISTDERKVLTNETDSTGEIANESFLVKTERDITLPGPVSDSGLTHELANGVFTVIVPKQHA